MPTPFHFFFDGQWAVIFFFTLSGFYYYRDEQFRLQGYLRGLIKKTLRIYPPHLISLILGWGLLMVYLKHGIYAESNLLTPWASGFWKDNVSFVEFLCNATVLAPHNPDVINPPSWYLSPEVKMFILMPVIVAVSNRCKSALSILLFVICWFLKLPFISCVGPFVAGFLLHAFLSRKRIAKINGLLAFTILFVGCILLNIKNIAMFFSLDTSHPSIMMIQSMGGLSLIFLANVLNFRRRFGALLFIGNISYEFYIVHFIVLMSLAPWISHSCIFIALCLSITLFVAYWIHKLEKKILLLL